MRIAYVTQSFRPMTGSTAIFASQLAEAMSTRGHQVLALTASHQIHTYHTYKENLTILRFQSINNPIHNGQRLFVDPRRTSIKALLKFQPDIVHTHEFTQNGISVLEYARRTHIPTMLTIHQLPHITGSYILKPLVEKIFRLHASKIMRQHTVIFAPTQTIAINLTQLTGLKTTLLTDKLDSPNRLPLLFQNTEPATHQKQTRPHSLPLLLHIQPTQGQNADSIWDIHERLYQETIKQTRSHYEIGSKKPPGQWETIKAWVGFK